jgi:hypothetical protein
MPAGSSLSMIKKALYYLNLVEICCITDNDDSTNDGTYEMIIAISDGTNRALNNKKLLITVY